MYGAPNAETISQSAGQCKKSLRHGATCTLFELYAFKITKRCHSAIITHGIVYIITNPQFVAGLEEPLQHLDQLVFRVEAVEITGWAPHE